MKKYYLLLAPLIFSACMDEAKPIVLDSTFKPYNKIQQACLKIINDESPHNEEKRYEILSAECEQFIVVLDGANQAILKMKKNKNNAAFYTANEKYKKEKKRLKIQHKHLNLIIKKQALDAIDADDLEQFTRLVQFPYHPMNLNYYHYMKKNMPHFKDTKKYFHFEKKYSRKKYQEGYKLVNKGKYTQGLARLEIASKMKNIPASQLCGDTFTYMFPSKAMNCYQRGVDLGNKHMMLSLARAYEKEGNVVKANDWYLKSAQAGNFISQYKLYHFKPNENISWLKKSADRGYDKAQFAYGMHMFKIKEYASASKYLLKASKQGYAKANYPLGKIYFAQKSYKKAYAYLSKGTVNDDSMYKLGYLKEHGKGTSKNYYTAATYYTKAKKLGKANAQKDINRMNAMKKRLRKAQIKYQKASAKASYAEIIAKAKRKYLAQKEDDKIRANWDARKAEEKRLRVQACGEEPSSSSLKSCGARIHIQGTLTQWLRNSAFLVSAGGKEYIVIDENDDAKLNKGDSVNIVTVSTGKREKSHGLRRSLFEAADESAITKAYALTYDSVCPY